MARSIDADELKSAICESYNPYQEYWAGTISRMHNLIDEQPTVDGWTPCSEELPKKSGRYLAIVEFVPSKIQIVEILVFKKTGRTIPRWFRQGRGNNVIAWRELPEPYKGE